MVSKEILDKFKSLYKEKYNIILTEEEATELVTQFLTLMKILIMPEEKIDDIPNCLTE